MDGRFLARASPGRHVSAMGGAERLESRAAARAEYALEQALDAGDVANIARAELDADFELYRRAAGEVIERS